MASVQRLELINQNITADKTESKGVELKATDFVAFMKTENRVAGTFNCLIQHSADGTNWETLCTFAAQSSNTFETIQQSSFTAQNILPSVRAVLTTAGGPDADITVALYYDKKA